MAGITKASKKLYLVNKNSRNVAVSRRKNIVIIILMTVTKLIIITKK